MRTDHVARPTSGHVAVAVVDVFGRHDGAKRVALTEKEHFLRRDDAFWPFLILASDTLPRRGS